MPNYVYNKNKWDGKYHEVHTTECGYRPKLENQVSLGWHATCKQAILNAQSLTGQFDFDGCKHCCKECHKG